MIQRSDWQKLWQAVRRLFEEAGTRKEMGKRGQAYVEKEMTLQRHVDRLEETFQTGARL